LIAAFCHWYVRQDNRFYAVGRLGHKLGVEDIKRISLIRFKEEFPDVDLEPEMLKAVFDVAIKKMHGDRSKMVPTWSGETRCDPGDDNPFLWEHGMVTVNTWRKPAYRSKVCNDRELDVFHQYMKWMFPRENELQVVLDWVAWNLRNEGSKPTWSLFLYSSTKGSFAQSRSRGNWSPSKKSRCDRTPNRATR